MQISPQTFLRFPCVLLQPFQHRIPRRIFSVPPAPASLDQLPIQVHSIRQDHVSKDAFVLVLAVGLDRNVFAEGEGRGSLLSLLPVDLAFLRAVDAAKADAVSMVTVHYFDGVAVEAPLLAPLR